MTYSKMPNIIILTFVSFNVKEIKYTGWDNNNKSTFCILAVRRDNNIFSCSTNAFTELYWHDFKPDFNPELLPNQHGC